MRKNGFTLMEMLISTMLIAITAACSVPVFINVVENNRNQEAITYLRLINAAQKIYYMKNKTYWPPTNGVGTVFGPTQGTMTDINTNLNLDLATPKYFDFLCMGGWTGAVANPTYHFEISATRTAGAKGSKQVFNLDESGTIINENKGTAV